MGGAFLHLTLMNYLLELKTNHVHPLWTVFCAEQTGHNVLRDTRNRWEQK